MILLEIVEIADVNSGFLIPICDGVCILIFSVTNIVSKSFTPNKLDDPPVTTNPPFTRVNSKLIRISNTQLKMSSIVA